MSQEDKKEKNILPDSSLLLNENSREADLMGRAILSDCFSFSKESQEKLRKYECDLLRGLFDVVKEEINIQAKNKGDKYSLEKFEFDIGNSDIQKLLSGKGIIALDYVHKIDKLVKSKHLNENPDFQEKVKKQLKLNYQEVLMYLTKHLEVEGEAKSYIDLWQYETCDWIRCGITDYYISYKINKNFDVYCGVCNDIAEAIHIYRSLDDKTKNSFREYIANLARMKSLQTSSFSQMEENKLKFITICSRDDKKEKQEFIIKCEKDKTYEKNTAEELINKILRMPLKYKVPFFTLIGHFQYMTAEDWTMAGNILLCEDKKEEILQTLKSYSEK